MKALILAGGMGTRLGKYTKNTPKCMVEFLGKPLVQRQIETLREIGIDDIILIRKHLAEKITFEGVRYVDETDYSTHMVAGLFEAESEFNDDLIISYGDLILERRVLEQAMNSKAEVGVVVDKDWKEYWTARNGDWTLDSESMIIGKDNRIISLGEEDSKQEDMHARYVGVIKISRGVLPRIKEIYHQAKKEHWDSPWKYGRSLAKAYMTDFIQGLIDNNIKVGAIEINRGWLQFDTETDYEQAIQWHENNELGKFINM